MSSGMKFIIYDKSREEYQVPWTGKTLVIGRRIDADIRVDEPTMSALHAKIYATSDGPMIRDLESLNGTHVNGRRVTEAALSPGDDLWMLRGGRMYQDLSNILWLSSPKQLGDSQERQDRLSAAIPRHPEGVSGPNGAT